MYYTWTMRKFILQWTLYNWNLKAVLQRYTMCLFFYIFLHTSNNLSNL